MIRFMMQPKDQIFSQEESLTYSSRDGLLLHYIRHAGGNGTPVLCLHGLSRNARDFSNLGRLLSHERTVYCPDFRGRGQSQWDLISSRYEPATYVNDVMTLLNHCGLERVILVGTSLGGIVSAGLSSILKNRIAGVVLNDIGPKIDSLGLTRISQHVGKGLVWRNWDEAIASIRDINGALYSDFTDSEWRVFAQQTCRQNDDGTIVPDYDPAIARRFTENAAAELDLWPLFLALKPIPSLLIRGALSDLLSKETTAEMMHRLPLLDLLTVPNRGHVPTLMEPSAASAIEAFVAKVDALES